MRNAFSAFSAHRSKMLSLLKPCLFRERKERTSGLARKLISNIYSNTIRMQLKLRHLADRRKIKLNGSSRNTHKIFRIGKPHTGRLYGLMICACKCRHLRRFIIKLYDIELVLFLPFPRKKPQNALRKTQKVDEYIYCFHWFANIVTFAFLSDFQFHRRGDDISMNFTLPPKVE